MQILRADVFVPYLCMRFIDKIISIGENLSGKKMVKREQKMRL